MSDAGSSSDNRRPLAALILAGGASRRMGTHKALLRAPGDGPQESFLDRLIGVFAPLCSPVIVVLGHEAAAIRAGAVRASQASFVINANHQEGQLSSLQCGLRAIPETAAGVLFTPVDFPGIRQATVARLAARFGEGAEPPLLAIPRFRERRGHPVCASRALFKEFLSLGAGGQAREVIHRYAGEAVYVDVDDPGILRDVDDPETYRALFSHGEPQ